MEGGGFECRASLWGFGASGLGFDLVHFSICEGLGASDFEFRIWVQG